MPTASSTLYAGPITVLSSETIQAVTVAASYSTSPVASAAYVINLPAAAPVFSVASGSYTSAQTVVLSSGTAGAQIFYTTNGSTPSGSSTAYSGPINVSASETIRAIAVAANYSASPVASAAYVINLPAAAPVFSVAAGTYTSVQTVSISSATASAQIYYTTNGTAPTTGSALYAGPITVPSSETIEAIAAAANYSTSPVASAAYVINVAAAPPVFSVAAGTYSSAQSVALSSTTPGAHIYYTTDGSVPTTSSTLYTSAIPVSTSETIQAIAVATSYSASGVASAAYVITSPGSLQLAPSTLKFLRPGEVYAATLTNTGGAAVSLSSIEVSSADWSQVSNCGTQIAGNSSCIIAITAGQSYGQFTGSLTVNGNDSAGAHTTALTSDIRQLLQGSSGTLYQGYPVNLGNGMAGMNAYATNFISGGVYQGTYGMYTVYNYSGTAIDGRNPAGLIIEPCSTKVSNTCSLNISAGPPVGPGSAYVTTNVPGETYYVTNFGLTATPSFVFSPVAVKGPSAAIGQTVTVNVTLVNSSTQSLLFKAPALTTGALNNGDFTMKDASLYGCQSLAANSPGVYYGPTCVISFTFSPTALGTRATVLTLTENHGYTQSVLITAEGVTPSLTVTPSLMFGTVPFGTTSAPLSILVVANSQDPVMATITGGAFALTGPTTCAQGASSCQFGVTFTPPYPTPFTGTVTLTDTVTGYSTTTSLSASGQ